MKAQRALWQEEGEIWKCGFFKIPRGNWSTRWKITSGVPVPGAKRPRNECFPYRENE